MMVENTFGDLVKRERSYQKKSLAKLSEELDGAIDPSYINRLEKGEKDNPGFKIVLLLSKVLNLDMREVYQAFQYEFPIVDFDKNAEVSIKDLIRLNKVLKPTLNDSEDHQRILSKDEKEALLSIIETVFEYALEEEANVNILASVMQKVHKLREVKQREIEKNKDIFHVTVDEVEYTIELDPLLHEHVRDDFEEWKKALEQEIEKVGNKLRDYTNGIFYLEILGSSWIVQKNRLKIKILSESENIIPL